MFRSRQLSVLVFAANLSLCDPFSGNADTCRSLVGYMLVTCDLPQEPTPLLDCNLFIDDVYNDARCDAEPYFDCLFETVSCDEENDTVFIDTVGCAPLLVCNDK